MRVGELSASTEVSSRSIRHYERTRTMVSGCLTLRAAGPEPAAGRSTRLANAIPVTDATLDEIALARRGELTAATIDTDENVRTTARFQVRSAPTILFFKHGQRVDRIVGAVPRARIEAMIVKHA